MSTSQIDLIENYNIWYYDALMKIVENVPTYSLEMFRVEAARFLTEQTVLDEPVSMPWGGRYVGIAGWEAMLTSDVRDVAMEFLSNIKFTEPTYYQKDNVVLRELSWTVAPTAIDPEPWVTWHIEKYWVEGDRIVRIDEYYQDTATLLKRMGMLSPS